MPVSLVNRRSCLPLLVLLWLFTLVEMDAGAADLPALLASIRSVGPEGAGHQQAAEAYGFLVQIDAGRLPEILAAMDGANPLAENWIRAAVDTIAERALRTGGRLPQAELERFLADTAHAPRARRLAFEWITRCDPSSRDRLVGNMLLDPSVELRRDAVDMAIRRAEQLARPQAHSGATGEEVIAAWRAALRGAADLDQVQHVAEQLEAFGEKVDIARHLGIVTRWRIIGPFDNRGGVGFDAVYPPEQKIDYDAQYDGKSGPVRWIEYTTNDPLGMVDLNAVLVEEKGVVAYAAAEIWSSRPRDVEIRVSSLNAPKVWLGGALVLERPIYHAGEQFDQYVAAGRLQPGKNQILVKVCQNEQTQAWARPWRFRLRVCDAVGQSALERR